MMKTMTRLAALSAGMLVLGSYSVSAQSADAAAKPAAQAAAPGKVAQALEQIKTFNGKPDPSALVYLYLQSASWCGPCNMGMPTVVATYKEMRKDGRVEIVLLGHDRTEDAAKAFLEKYGAGFPGVLATAENVDKLPGYAQAHGIPSATFVDANGNVLASGHPVRILANWKAYADQAEAAVR